MSLFSFRRNSAQEAADDGAYRSRTEDDSKAIRPRKRKAASRREEAADPVLPEKKRARRRLVGAVALVLAAIIGLPMILDSEPKPVADDIAIQIPSRDSLPPLAPPPAALAAPTGSAEAATDSVTASLDEKEELLEVPAPAPAPAPKIPAPKAAPKPAPSSAAVATPAPAAATPAAPSAKPVPRDNDGARALALLEGRAEPARAGSEKFVIQVAALASREKVNEVRDKLKRAGIESYTQTVATQNGSVTRIRVGPFANREEAEKVRARIVQLGLGGSLVPA